MRFPVASIMSSAQTGRPAMGLAHAWAEVEDLTWQSEFIVGDIVKSDPFQQGCRDTTLVF